MVLQEVQKRQLGRRDCLYQATAHYLPSDCLECLVYKDLSLIPAVLEGHLERAVRHGKRYSQYQKHKQDSGGGNDYDPYPLRHP